MSFTITLQRNTTEVNRVTKGLVTVATLNGTLRNESNVVDPTILVEVNNLPNFNYLTIPEFNRSYYVTDIKSVRNNLWEITAHSDPLQSFKSQLLDNWGLILRQENVFDLYINDGVFKSKQNDRLGYISFPSGFSDFNYILLAACGAQQNT